MVIPHYIKSHKKSERDKPHCLHQMKLLTDIQYIMYVFLSGIYFYFLFYHKRERQRGHLPNNRDSSVRVRSENESHIIFY